MEVPNIEMLSLEAAGKEHVADPVIQFQYSNAKGEGYLGIVKSVKLEGKNKDLDIIVKLASASDNLRKQAPIREAFETEIAFYEHVIPTFIKFQLDEAIKNPFVCFPKCYATCLKDGAEVLLLENLRGSGFTSWDRQKPMNHEHLAFVFKEYGRLHAISFALKKKDPKKFKELAGKLHDVMLLFYIKSGFNKMLKQLTDDNKCIFNAQSEKNLYDAYCAFGDNGSELIKECSKNDDYTVITHGDCWSNNMMFKYKDPNCTNEPYTMQLIDFQLSKEASPVQDLSYYFYACSTGDSLNRLNEYLCIYHNSLKETLNQFNCDVEKLYPFTKLKEHWKRFSKFGIIMAHVVVKAMLSDSDEAPDLSEIAEKGADITSSFNYTGRNQEQYRQRMRELFLHVHRCQFL